MTPQDLAAARDTLSGAAEAVRVLVHNLAFVQGADLSSLAVELSHLAASARGGLAATTAEAVSRGVVLESGSGSAAAWLTDAGALLSEPESHLLRRAVESTRASALAGLREALTEGAVSSGDACTAARVYDELRTATDPAMHPDIADAVTTLARTGLSRRILQRFKSDMLARHGTLDDEQRQRDHAEARRGLSAWRLLPDGLWGIEGVFDPADKAVIDAALTALSAPAPDPATGEVDVRRPSARRADALVTMARRVAEADVSGPMGATTRVSLLLPPEALARPCPHRAKDAFGLLRGDAGEPCDCLRPVASHDELGTTLLPAQARELSCGAVITPVVLGAQGQPLAVGRTRRLATEAQRRALDVRDGGCSFPGCTAPPSWTQAHHVVHWGDGGATDLDNLALLCARHHRFVHLHDVTGRVSADGSRMQWDVACTPSGWRPVAAPDEQRASSSPPDASPPDASLPGSSPPDRTSPPPDGSSGSRLPHPARPRTRHGLIA